MYYEGTLAAISKKNCEQCNRFAVFGINQLGSK